MSEPHSPENAPFREVWGERCRDPEHAHVRIHRHRLEPSEPQAVHFTQRPGEPRPTEHDESEPLLVSAVLDQIRSLPESEATQSRDYGRGYARAIKDVLAILDPVQSDLAAAKG